MSTMSQRVVMLTDEQHESLPLLPPVAIDHPPRS